MVFYYYTSVHSSLCSRFDTSLSHEPAQLQACEHSTETHCYLFFGCVTHTPQTHKERFNLAALSDKNTQSQQATVA